jgi:hypothetical protein
VILTTVEVVVIPVHLMQPVWAVAASVKAQPVAMAPAVILDMISVVTTPLA